MLRRGRSFESVCVLNLLRTQEEDARPRTHAWTKLNFNASTACAYILSPSHWSSCNNIRCWTFYGNCDPSYAALDMFGGEEFNLKTLLLPGEI